MATYITEDLQKSSFEPLEENRYDLIINNAEIKSSPIDGHEIIKLTFGVINSNKYKNRNLWFDLDLSQSKFKSFSAPLIVASGSKILEKPSFETPELVQDLIHRKVNAFVTATKKGDKVFNNLKNFKPYVLVSDNTPTLQPPNKSSMFS